MFARAHPLGVTAAFGVWTAAIDRFCGIGRTLR